jgi:hypothetical protein
MDHDASKKIINTYTNCHQGYHTICKLWRAICTNLKLAVFSPKVDCTDGCGQLSQHEGIGLYHEIEKIWFKQITMINIMIKYLQRHHFHLFCHTSRRNLGPNFAASWLSCQPAISHPINPDQSSPYSILNLNAPGHGTG